MRRATWSLLVVLALGCGTQSSDVSAVIGAEGGTLAVSDTRSPLFGVRVEVPAGALATSTLVTLRPGAAADSLPGVPVGVAAFAPVIELATDAPFQQAVRLVFPIRSAPLGIDKLPGGLHLDAASGSWRLVLAAAIEPQAFSVDTLEPGTWRWGVALVETVEYQTLKPAMEALHGTAQWAQDEADFRREVEARVESFRQTEGWTDCDGLKVVASVLAQARDATAQSIEQTLATTCGGCSVTSAVFVDELMDYFKAKALERLGDLVIEMANMNVLLELYTRLRSAIYIHNLLEKLACDYQCLVDTPPPGFWPNVAAYSVCNIALVAIAIGASYSGCALGP